MFATSKSIKDLEPLNEYASGRIHVIPQRSTYVISQDEHTINYGPQRLYTYHSIIISL